MLQTSLLLMKSLNKTEAPIFYNVLFISKGNPSILFISMQLVLVPCGGRRTSARTLT